jgi:hypothetical protein
VYPTCTQLFSTVSRLWLYTLVSADYGGAALLPHFLEYYYNKNRIFYSRMLVNVHHNPEKYTREGLDTILGICSSYRVYCRWGGRFTGAVAWRQSDRTVSALGG